MNLELRSFCHLFLLSMSDNVTLGNACGKTFRVCVLSINDPGDSDIVRSVPKEE